LNIIHLRGTTSISRKNFNLDFGPMDGLIGNEIKVRLSIVAKK